MSGLTKLGFSLILILSLFLVGFTAELLYLVFRRRIRPDSADPERTAGSSAGTTPPRAALLFHALCLNSKRRSRVEPASAVDPARAKATKAEPNGEDEEESDLARWLAVCLGPSRALYTIKEEEPEEEEEEGGDDEAPETPFETPCASLRFESPSPSPSPPPETAEAVDPAPGGAHRKLVFAWRGLYALPYRTFMTNYRFL